MNNRAFVIVCAVLLFLPGLATFVDKFAPTAAGDVEKTEARKMATAPEPEWMWQGRWSEFTHQSELFLNDHFGLRAPLLALNAQIRRVFRSPASTDVVVGRRGWFFYSDGLVNQSARGDEDAVPRLVAQADMLQALHERLRQDGSDFAVLIAPDKHTIYPEMLPSWLADRQPGTQYDRLVAELRQRGVPVVDIREKLHALKAQGPVYYRTDTHWTMLGALTAFNEVLAVTGRPPLADIGVLQFKETVKPGMDLGRMALMGRMHREYLVSPYRGDMEFVRTPLRIPNDPGRLAFRLHRPGKGATMVVIGDSFTRTYFRNPAMDLSKRMTWLHHQACGFDWTTVRKAKADLVVYEVVERNLGCSPTLAEKKAARIRKGMGA